MYPRRRRVLLYPLLPVCLPPPLPAGTRRSGISLVDLLRHGVWRVGRIPRGSWIGMWIQVGRIGTGSESGIEIGTGIGITINGIIVERGGLGGDSDSVTG